MKGEFSFKKQKFVFPQYNNFQEFENITIVYISLFENSKNKIMKNYITEKILKRENY